MAATAHEGEWETTPLRRVVLASLIGTTIEWYDFFLYGTAAALIFNKLFFPSFDPLTGTLLAFATYWVGYLSRPFGGILFGNLGDRRGRRYVLVMTLLIMGACTTLIGLLPTYEKVGVLAPILLVTLRFVQGMALGGEWAGAVLLTVEHGTEQGLFDLAQHEVVQVRGLVAVEVGEVVGESAFGVVSERHFECAVTSGILASPRSFRRHYLRPIVCVRA